MGKGKMKGQGYFYKGKRRGKGQSKGKGFLQWKCGRIRGNEGKGALESRKGNY